MYFCENNILNMEDLSFDNIEFDLDNTLFEDPSVLASSDGDDEEGQSGKNNKKEKDTELDSNTLFDTTESVGGEDNQEEEDDDADDKSEENRTANTFYSSIASALVDDGVLSSIDKKSLKDIKDAESFAELLKKEIESKLTEEQQRVRTALDSGLEPSEITKYEKTLEFLNNFTEDSINEESDEAELRRKQLIYQDYINKGFSSEKAVKEVEKSVNAGTDIEDALDALEANKVFYTKQYNDLIKAEQTKKQTEADAVKAQVETLKKAVLDTEEPFEGYKLDKATRALVLKIVADPNTKGEDGKMYTALQQFQLDKPTEFLHKVGLLYHLTDGFTKLDKLVKAKVNKEKLSSLKDLEHGLINSRVSGGSPVFTSGVSSENDSETYHGLTLDF